MLSVTYLYSVTEGLTIWLLNHFLNRLTRFLLKLANPLSINLLMFYFLHLHMVLLRLITYTARHSFATLALSYGVSIESISGMLGHTNITTTQIYAQITKQKIGVEMREFERGMINTDEFSKRIKKGYDIYLQLLDTARRMKEDKFSIEQIIYYTGLSRDEIIAS